jgi:hypothetical protein
MATYAPIVYRDRITVHADARADGATQPAYTDELCRETFAEVQQVAGGQVVRGKTVEAITAFVVSLRNIPSIPIGADCQVTVTSGPYKDQVLFVHRVYYENMHGRPVRQQLHCKTRKK